MENALFITKIRQLNFWNKRYGRLYFGHEFCERQIPGLNSLRRALDFARSRDIAFTFVSPYVTDAGLVVLRKSLDFLSRQKFPCEIVVNDWGVLNLASREYPGIVPVLGRLLTKQKRGLHVKNLLQRDYKSVLLNDSVRKKKEIIFFKKMPPRADYYYKGTNAGSVPVIHDFLISRGISRIELDNPEQGVSLALPAGRIFASVYTPYVYIATTFYCPSAGCANRKRSFLKIKLCGKECGRFLFELRHKSMPMVIYLKGNTQFYKNPGLMVTELSSRGVDRIVYQPEIPV
jgi:hypothetical protein